MCRRSKMNSIRLYLLFALFFISEIHGKATGELESLLGASVPDLDTAETKFNPDDPNSAITNNNVKTVQTEGGEIIVPIVHNSNESHKIVSKKLDSKDTPPPQPVQVESIKHGGEVSSIKPRKGVHDTKEIPVIEEHPDDVAAQKPVTIEPDQSAKETVAANASSTLAPDVAKVSQAGPSTTVQTTTLKPKKPEATYSVEDEPEKFKNVKDPQRPKTSYTLAVEEPEKPHVANSQEQFVKVEREDDGFGVGTYLFMSAITICFVVLPVMFYGRRFKDWWATRHYSRVDFLVDGMYND